MKIPTIDEAAGMSDEELGTFMGLQDQLTNFKAELSSLSSLKGPAKAEAERLWRERFTPSVSSDSLRWMKEDAIRATRTPKQVLESTDVEDLG